MHLPHSLARAALFVVMRAGFLTLLASPGCRRADGLPAEDPGRLKIQVRSSAFTEGGMIPQTFSCDSADTSPPLEWSGAPPSAHSLVLIVDDPDAPMGTWSHWVVFNLPPEANALKQGVPAQETIPPGFVEGPDTSAEHTLAAIQGQNDFGKHGYSGPCPPAGTHRYFFRLYALDIGLHLDSKATRADVLKEIGGHVLAEGRLFGKYARSRTK
jgi:Raf kinase inhibitor-like YbhB/YbcL family protein